MPEYRPGRLIRDARRRLDLTQDDVARWIKNDRSVISQLETTGRKKPLDPDKTKILAEGLRISPLILLEAMGYELGLAGKQAVDESVLLAAYRAAGPDLKQQAGAILGLPGDWQKVEFLEQVRRLAEMDLQDRRGIPE